MSLISLVLVAAIYGGMGGFSMGMYRFNNTAINNKLTSLGLTKIERIYTDGGFGYGIMGKILVGGGGIGGTVKRTQGDLEIVYSVGGGYGQIGYIPWSYMAFNPFVMIGFGGFSEGVTLRKKVVDMPWDSVWANPEREVTISRGSFSIAPSLGILLVIPKIPVGFMVMASYHTLFSDEWKWGDSYDISNPPDSPKGSYSVSFTLLFGGGNWIQKGN